MKSRQGKEVNTKQDRVSESRETGRRLDSGLERRQELPGKRQAISERDRVETALARRQTGQSEKQATRAAKADITEKIVSKSFSLNEAKQGDNSRDFHFQDKDDFDKEVHQWAPDIDLEGKKVVGYHDPRDNQAFIRDQGNTLETAVHEKLHQKSGSKMPTRLNEGVTEYFTRQGAGEIGRLKNIDNRGREIPHPVSDYEHDREIVGKLSATVGDAPLHAAYFDGKTDELQQHVDSALGPGAFEEVNDALKSRDYERADAVLKRGGDRG
ncbi:MAG: hypothetical protein J0665_04310 [Deltaproteobacteria bacterium]|nr:hypothetical protein [Deltaproteobacteria bacterium]